LWSWWIITICYNRSVARHNTCWQWSRQLPAIIYHCHQNPNTHSTTDWWHQLELLLSTNMTTFKQHYRHHGHSIFVIYLKLTIITISWFCIIRHSPYICTDTYSDNIVLRYILYQSSWRNGVKISYIGYGYKADTSPRKCFMWLNTKR